MDKSETAIRDLTREWTRAQPAVGRFVRSFVRNRADADDLLQEVALTIVEKFDKYDPSRPFIGWALGIARNVVKAHFRKQLRTPTASAEEGVVDQVANAFEALQPEMEDMKEALSRCIEGVRSEDRALLAMQYEEALKPAAIADRVGKSPNHVAVVMHRIRLGLKQCVERKLRTLEGHA
ncbi:MAG: sigma-70 family RNA polymerase sigma factor [Verrucomicrobiota bacterium]